MTCKQLGGACDTTFQAEIFEDIAQQSKAHAIQMANDEAHKSAMQQMNQLMQNPDKIQQWIKEKKQEFEALPDN